jgi:hypothetical protein
VPQPQPLSSSHRYYGGENHFSFGADHVIHPELAVPVARLQTLNIAVEARDAGLCRVRRGTIQPVKSNYRCGCYNSRPTSGELPFQRTNWFSRALSTASFTSAVVVIHGAIQPLRRLAFKDHGEVGDDRWAALFIGHFCAAGEPSSFLRHSGLAQAGEDGLFLESDEMRNVYHAADRKSTHFGDRVDFRFELERLGQGGFCLIDIPS